MQMAAAFPAGWAADYYRRDTILRVSALIGALGGISLGVALALHSGYWPVIGAMALLGIYKGVYTPASEAIFSDSVPTGRRWVLFVILRE
jgi:MFS family permease